MCGISSALDGSEDELLFQLDSDDDEPFEGLTAADGEGQLADGVALDDVNEWGEPSKCDGESDNAADPASLGH